ncbi:MAG: hypothetical protein HY336_00805 [Candidatus Doudnabacteria bacterium]|nr:hypothetical protein [Candidatus Doudnabacteria bacterium]
MKQKLIYFSVIITFLLLAGVLFFLTKDRNTQVYKDEENKVSFVHPKNFQTGSQKGFVTLFSEPDQSNNLKMILTVNPAMFFVEARGLTDQAQTMELGGKTFRFIHKQEQDQTFTHLYLEANGQKYLFEISPWQKDSWDEGMLKVLKTFKSL